MVLAHETPGPGLTLLPTLQVNSELQFSSTLKRCPWSDSGCLQLGFDLLGLSTSRRLAQVLTVVTHFSGLP